MQTSTPANSEALRQLAATAQAQGRFDEARSALEQLLRLAPKDADAWSALCGVLLADRRPDAALRAAEAGLARAPGAGLHCARARALRGLGRIEDAEAALRRALAADPHCEDARFDLALHAIEAGDWEGAAAIAGPLLSRSDGGARADWLAARIALGRGEHAEAAARARRALSAPALSAQQQADAELLLGEALDALGEAPAAFASVARGKAILRRIYARRATGRESELGKLMRLADWFRNADPRPWLASPDGSAAGGERAHAFLVGFPRSGTTLLEQALAGHPDLVALEEAPTLAGAYDAFLADAGGLGRLARLSAGEAAHWRGEYWRVVAERGLSVAGKVFLDKAPAGTLCVPLVAKLFPQAKLLFAVRDPRDVVLSCLRSSFQMNALTYAFTDLVETARCYAATMELAALYRQALPIQPMAVRYETLVDDFEAELVRIAAFLGLEFAPAMLDVARTATRRAVRTPSAPQVRAGLNRRGLGRWRAYERELAPVLPILAPWIRRLGYGDDESASSAAPSATFSGPNHGS